MGATITVTLATGMVAAGVLAAQLLGGSASTAPSDIAAGSAAEAAVSMLAKLPAALPGAGQSAGLSTTTSPALPVTGAATSVAVPDTVVLAARRAQQAAATEAEVQRLRRHGEGEDAVYRTRMTQMPAPEVAQMMAREQAETAWLAKLPTLLAECTTGCQVAQGGQAAQAGLTNEEQGRLSAYQAPSLVLQGD